MAINNIYEIKTALDSLTVFRGLLKDDVISKLYILVRQAADFRDFSEFISSYGDFYYTLAENNSVNSLKDYMINLIVYTDNAFSRHCESYEFDRLDAGLLKAAENDLRCLEKAVSVRAADIKESILVRYKHSDFEYEAIKRLPEWDFGHQQNMDNNKVLSIFYTAGCWAECIKPLANFHRNNGSGEFAKYKGFVWERCGAVGRLQGVVSPDPVRFRDLIGYEQERKVVIDNTLQFLRGYPANNILLYGDRGTGKSSTVKALMNEYADLGLRIIEIPKMLISDLPHILRIIKDRQQKFIVFIDDLSFDDNEESYTSLKAMLEGGLETKPGNMVIYATSNRRHLVKEKFSDRAGMMYGSHEDEVRAADTLQERLSLADRFGITVTFSAPDKNKYLEIVEGLARNRGLDIDKEVLHKEALKWEMWHNGLSPRTARQFIDWLEGRQI